MLQVRKPKVHKPSAYTKQKVDVYIGFKYKNKPNERRRKN